jgi:hypothetical protein
MWDVVTTCWLADQSFFQRPTTLNLAIDATLDNTQGCIKPAANGRAVQVVRLRGGAVQSVREPAMEPPDFAVRSV